MDSQLDYAAMPPYGGDAAYYDPILDSGDDWPQSDGASSQLQDPPPYYDSIESAEAPQRHGLPHDDRLQHGYGRQNDYRQSSTRYNRGELPQGVQQGMPLGVQQGMPQGAQQGVPQGVRQGIPQGVQQGVQQGMLQGMLQRVPQRIPQGARQRVPQVVPQGARQRMPQGVPQGARQRRPQGISQGVPALVDERALAQRAMRLHKTRKYAAARRSAFARRSSIAAVIAALFLLAYIPSTFNWLQDRNVSTDMLRMGVLQETYNTDALVVRDDKPLISITDGVSFPAVAAGERVAGNSHVATLYSQASVDLMAELKRVNRAIVQSQYDSMLRGAARPVVADSIEADISTIVRRLIAESGRNSLRAASQSAREINRLVLRKAEAYGAYGADDPYVVSLMKERERIQSLVALASVEIYTSEPGYVSFAVDGLEGELGPAILGNLGDIDASHFSSLLRIGGRLGQSTLTSGTASVSDSEGGYAVRDGAAFAKIVRGNDFYLIARIPADLAPSFSVGSTARVKANGPSREFDGVKVAYSSEPTSAGAFIAIEFSKYIFDFIDARVVNIDIVQRHQEGLKIPVKCLKDYKNGNDYAYVALLKANQASLRKVRILAANDVYAIVESYDPDDPEGKVNEFDAFLRDTDNIEDGMVLVK